MDVSVECGKQQLQLTLLVSRGKGQALMGRNWIQRLKLNWSKVNRIDDPVKKLCYEYKEVFSSDLGHIKGVKDKLYVSPEATSKFCKACPILCALQEAVDRKLNELQQQRVLLPAQHSEWATPIVCIPKKDGSVHNCRDYKLSIHGWTWISIHYPNTGFVFKASER